MDAHRLLPKNGAGGTEGGVGRFLVAVLMIVIGGYLLLNSIHVTSSFGLGYGLYRIGGWSVTSGMVLLPFVFGVGMVFYNGKNLLGWLLAGGSLAALIAGVITSIHFRIEQISAFDLLVILVLFVGGIGLLLSSLRPLPR